MFLQRHSNNWPASTYSRGKNVFKNTVYPFPPERHSTVCPLTIPFSVCVCYAHCFLLMLVCYLEVKKHILTLHNPWQGPMAPKAVKYSVHLRAVVPSQRDLLCPSQVAQCDNERLTFYWAQGTTAPPDPRALGHVGFQVARGNLTPPPNTTFIVGG